MAKKKTTGRGALAKDPPKAKPSNTTNKTVTAPTRGENKAIFEGMTPEQQKRYIRLRANKGLEAANKYMAKTSGQTPTGPGGRKQTPEERRRQPAAPLAPPNEPAPGTPFEQLTPEQQGQEMGDVGGQVFTQMGGYAQQFDPATMQQNYEIGFAQERERYTKNLMDQFERRNQRQFEQQRLATQQQIAERGLDPASPAAQELMRQQNEREDMARQEAMTAAEQGSYGIAGQAFGQARELALTPGQIAGQFMEPAMLGYQQAGAMNLAEQQAAAAMEQQRLQGRQAIQQIRATPRGGGGGGGGAPGLTPWQRLEAQSLMQGEQPEINPFAAGAQGLVQGATGQVTSNLNRR